MTAVQRVSAATLRLAVSARAAERLERRAAPAELVRLARSALAERPVLAAPAVQEELVEQAILECASFVALQG